MYEHLAAWIATLQDDNKLNSFNSTSTDETIIRATQNQQICCDQLYFLWKLIQTTLSTPQVFIIGDAPVYLKWELHQIEFNAKNESKMRRKF